MIYELVITIALAIFVAGLIFKISRWFSYSVDIRDQTVLPSESSRFRTALKGIRDTLKNQKRSGLIRVLLRDVLAQIHLFKADRQRWLMHMLIFAGFTFLLVTHAFDKFIFTTLYSRFYLILNPFLFLAGLMVLAGVGLAVYRRYLLKVARLTTSGPDIYLLVILAVIMLSGMAMELTKLTSYDNYQLYWNIHLAACLFGLAYLPFSKLMHAFTTPISLMANAVMDDKSEPANIRTRQIMELDACTRCDTCSNRCSVATAFDSLGNPWILPSERMKILQEYFANKSMDTNRIAAITQGIYLCTNCDRCTVACPAGINLRELWFDAREELIRRGDSPALTLTPFSYFRGLRSDRFDTSGYEVPLDEARKGVLTPFEPDEYSDDTILIAPETQAFGIESGLREKAGTFTACFSCENCSTVCPVVGEYDNPEAELDLLPHQIMRSMAFGIKDLALGSTMLWHCLTCYQCQEHCPQSVQVTDIMFELKTLAVKETAKSAAVASG